MNMKIIFISGLSTGFFMLPLILLMNGAWYRVLPLLIWMTICLIGLFVISVRKRIKSKWNG